MQRHNQHKRFSFLHLNRIRRNIGSLLLNVMCFHYCVSYTNINSTKASETTLVTVVYCIFVASIFHIDMQSFIAFNAVKMIIETHSKQLSQKLYFQLTLAHPPTSMFLY